MHHCCYVTRTIKEETFVLGITFLYFCELFDGLHKRQLLLQYLLFFYSSNAKKRIVTKERLFLVKKVKTSFYHDLMIYTKRDASLTSEASDRRPFECKSSKSDRKTLLFLQDVFFFNFRGFQTSRHLLMWFCGECQKSHLEIRSSYGSRDSFFHF